MERLVAIGAERAILASVLINENALLQAVDSVIGDDFYKIEHQQMFDSILYLVNNRKKVDLITVTNELKNRGQLMEIGGASFIAALLNDEIPISNIQSHIDIIKEKAILREIAAVGQDVNALVMSEYQESGDVLSGLQEKIISISSKRTKANVMPMGEALKDTFARIEQLRDPNFVDNTFISSGYEDLDKLIGGFKNAQLSILAARPSVGKTALSLNFAYNVALNQLPVLFFSLEMSTQQLTDRFLSRVSHVRTDDFNVQISDKNHEKLIASMAQLSELPIYIEDSGGLSVMKMRFIARQYKLKHNIRFIVIDYLQFMTSGKRRVESRLQEVSEIVREIKNIAKELDVPVLALSQLSRAVEQRTDKRPQLSDLRETGEIEQTADVVMFLHRDDYYNKNEAADALSGHMSPTDIIVSKNRTGATGDVKMMYKRDISQFFPLDPLPVRKQSVG